MPQHRDWYSGSFPLRSIKRIVADVSHLRQSLSNRQNFSRDIELDSEYTFVACFRANYLTCFHFVRHGAVVPRDYATKVVVAAAAVVVAAVAAAAVVAFASRSFPLPSQKTFDSIYSAYRRYSSQNQKFVVASHPTNGDSIVD